jgi:hypothetical protein
MNPAKELSDYDGRRFLQEAFHKDQTVLAANLEFAEHSITHDGKRGDVAENHFLDGLRRYLPHRYSASSAIVIDSLGHTSDQIDIVIYDQQFTPVLLDQRHHKYVPAEAVYAVLEVKPTINRDYLQYAGGKAASVRRLYRTSCPIPHAGGTYPPKVLFPIIAGLVAAKIDWAEGFGATFIANHNELTGDKALDCGLALDRGAFDLFAGAGAITYAPPKNALIFFLFRLLQRLQSLGSVPAIDWNAYAAHLSDPTLTHTNHA